MQVVYHRCCGLDIHKKLIVACLLSMSAQGVHKEMRTFGTTLADLYRLRDWLVANECQIVAMESTGVYTPPTILPSVGGILRRARRPGRADAEDHTDVPLIHLNPFDQRTNNFTTR